MKTARYYGIRDVRFEEQPRPACGEEDALIRVRYAGICGSDLHIYNKQMFIQNIPETMGHEFVGVIESTGPAVRGFAPGDVVVANPMVPCLACDSCRAGHYNTCRNLGFIGEVRQGCFAEYIAMPASSLIKTAAVPEDDALLRQLALTEPLAVVLNLCERAALTPEDELAVVGAGPIGLLTVLAARELYGVRAVTAVNRSEPRRKLAAAVGAHEVYETLPAGRTYGKVVEAAGREGAFQAALEHTAPGGSLYVVSIFEEDVAADLNTLVASQISLVGCNVYEKRHLEAAADAIASGRLDVTPLITETFALEECADAFRRVTEKDAAKVLFKI